MIADTDIATRDDQKPHFIYQQQICMMQLLVLPVDADYDINTISVVFRLNSTLTRHMCLQEVQGLLLKLPLAMLQPPPHMWCTMGSQQPTYQHGLQQSLSLARFLKIHRLLSFAANIC